MHAPEGMRGVRSEGGRGGRRRPGHSSPALGPNLSPFPARQEGARTYARPFTRPLSLSLSLQQTVAWAFLTVILLLTWLAAAAALGDAPGPAWTPVHLAHAAVSFYLLHWAKGSPVPADQGKYDTLTFWEQVRNGRGRERRSGRKGRALCLRQRPLLRPAPDLAAPGAFSHFLPLPLQLDDGVQNTGTRKFLTVLPVATFLLASHGTAWERQV